MHGITVAAGVDFDHPFLAPEQFDDRLGLRAVFSQSSLDGLRGVVLARYE